MPAMLLAQQPRVALCAVVDTELAIRFVRRADEIEDCMAARHARHQHAATWRQHNEAPPQGMMDAGAASAHCAGKCHPRLGGRSAGARARLRQKTTPWCQLETRKSHSNYSGVGIPTVLQRQILTMPNKPYKI